jgi:hypothetical protein
MAMRKYLIFMLIALSIIILVLVGWRISLLFNHPSVYFDGQRAYQDVLAQVAFGPRIPNSQAHAETVDYIQKELIKAGWKAELQNTTWRGFAILNIIASSSGLPPQIIFGAHYDSRLLADQDCGCLAGNGTQPPF